MFLTLEGLDGAGTTSQATRLARRLEAAGHGVVATAEPSTGPLGTLIRQALRGRLVQRSGERVLPDALALLFASDRVDHVGDVVVPALERGNVVISDRYVHSSLAYQGAECDMEWVAQINAKARVADLTVFLSVPVEECLRRIGVRGEDAELFERLDVLEAVAARYEQAFSLRDERVVRIDGTQSMDAVEAAIWAVVHQALGAAPAS